jgi:large subunit GTPase 1
VPAVCFAGVIPIDRLTDVRTPVDVIAKRIPRRVLEATYSAQLRRPSSHEPADA